MSATALIKSVAPPVLWNFGKRLLRRGLIFSEYRGDWAGACRMSSSYSADVILERVAAATRAVIAGEAAYERDSVLFHTPEPPLPLLVALLRAAALNNGRLQVLDFGGSLGSTYRQCRPYLEGLQEVHWVVLEQPGFARRGQTEFSTDELQFAASFDGIATPTILIAASVLQYIEHPYQTLSKLSATGSRHFIIERTPFHDGVEHRLCVQQVPKDIYPASYPCWIFSRESFLEWIERDWRVLYEYPTSDGRFLTDTGLRFEFKGLMLERRS